MTREVEYFAYALRYFPNLVTGEFVNVGVALVAPDARWWDIRVAKGLKGFRRVFPTAQPRALKAALHRIERAVVRSGTRTRHDANSLIRLLDRWDNPLQPVRAALGTLLGSLSWAEVPICGVTTDPAAELSYWFDQLVQVQADQDASAQSRREHSGQLAALIESEFGRRGILERMRPAEVGTYAKQTFDFTYTNGRLNIFDAIRLNYATPSLIREHAQYWRGKLDTLSDGLEKPFNYFALVKIPEAPELKDEAEIGLTMIRNAHVNRVEAIPTNRVAEFGALAESVITSSNGNGNGKGH